MSFELIEDLFGLLTAGGGGGGGCGGKTSLRIFCWLATEDTVPALSLPPPLPPAAALGCAAATASSKPPAGGGGHALPPPVSPSRLCIRK